MTHASIQRYVRAGGLMYLFIVAAGLFAQVFVRARLVVPGDAAATAANILESQALFRAAMAAELLVLLCDVALAVIFFVVFRPVSRHWSLFAAFLRVVTAAVLAVNLLNHLDALVWLTGPPDGIDPATVQGLAYHALRTHAYGYHVGLVFFGLHCLVLGGLVIRSVYFPRIIGVLFVAAGAGYLANSFGRVIGSAFVASLGPGLLLPALVAELSMASWMLLRGVDARKWAERHP